MSVAVLFVRSNSVYHQLGLDCYDINRDARTYEGTLPIVAHPPCRAWGKLSHFAKPRQDEKNLAIIAIDLIRKNGGVMEHPRSSRLWPAYLPLPGNRDEYDGYTISVDQFWWGHKATKSSFLYIVGCPQKYLPPIPMRLDAVEYVVKYAKRNKLGTRPNKKKEITKKEREATPIELAKWLVSVATLCNKNVNINS